MLSASALSQVQTAYIITTKVHGRILTTKLQITLTLVGEYMLRTGSKVIVRKGKPHGLLQPILEGKIFLFGPQLIHQVSNHIEILTLTMMSGKLLVMIARLWRIIWDLILIPITIQTHLTNHVYQVSFSTTQLLRMNWLKGLRVNMVRLKRRLTQLLSHGKRLLIKLGEIVRLPSTKPPWVCNYS